MMDFFSKKKNARLWRASDNLPWEETGLPDSDDPRGECPHCGHRSNFEVQGHMNISFDPRFAVLEPGRPSTLDVAERITGLVCRGCSRGMALVEQKCYLNDQPGHGKVVFKGAFAWPLPSAQMSSDIPEHISSIYSEAVVAHAARIPRAASLMARATLEAITLDKGEKSSDSLKKRIQNLAARQILQTDLASWADEVRLLGNAGAHDPASPVKLEDVKQLIDYIRELMKYLYELPAELARRRAGTTT